MGKFSLSNESAPRRKSLISAVFVLDGFADAL
jgi:hypothetical protein